MGAEPSADLVYDFGPVQAHPEPTGPDCGTTEPVKLGGRALDILHLLVMRAGEEVSCQTR
jgi:DNA-binding winged helix-turn-helix (wHTH) protein